METYKIIQKVESDIEDRVVKNVAANIGQLFADSRNSWQAMEIRTEGKVDMVLQKLESKYDLIAQKNEEYLSELTNVVSNLSASVDSRLFGFDHRLTKIENRTKWLLALIIAFTVIMSTINIVLIVREYSIVKNDAEIVNTLEDIKGLIEK